MLGTWKLAATDTRGIVGRVGAVFEAAARCTDSIVETAISEDEGTMMGCLVLPAHTAVRARERGCACGIVINRVARQKRGERAAASGGGAPQDRHG